MGCGAGILRPRQHALEELEHQRRAAIRSLWIRSQRVGVEPPRWGIPLHFELENVVACILRPGISNAGDGEPPARKLNPSSFARPRRSAATSTAFAGKLLRRRRNPGSFWENA